MAQQVTPEVLWAQRSSSSDPEKNYVLLTISVPDVPPKSLKLDLKPTGLTFTGASESKKTTYHVEMEFYEEIDPAESKTHHTPANIQIVLRKKKLEEEYWPRLLKSSAKVHYLRTDFDKWVDEDEQNEAPEDDYMNQFGGGAGGMGGEDGGFGGIDFSKLGAGAGGMGGMGGMGGDAAEGEEDEEEDEDEDMPELEEEEEGTTDKGKGKATDSKIEEVA